MRRPRLLLSNAVKNQPSRTWCVLLLSRRPASLGGVISQLCCRGNKRLCQTLVRHYWPTLFCIFAPSLLIKYEPPQTDSLFVFRLFFSHRLDSRWRKTRNLTLLASAGEEFLIRCSFIRPRLRSFTTTGRQKNGSPNKLLLFLWVFYDSSLHSGLSVCKAHTHHRHCCRVLLFFLFLVSHFHTFLFFIVMKLPAKKQNSSCYGEITLCDVWRCFVPLRAQQ